MAKLRDYDFVAARKRLVDRVNRTTKIVLDRAGDVSFDRTRLLRELQGSADAVRFTQHAVLAALVVAATGQPEPE